MCRVKAMIMPMLIDNSVDQHSRWFDGNISLRVAYCIWRRIGSECALQHIVKGTQSLLCQMT